MQLQPRVSQDIQPRPSNRPGEILFKKAQSSFWCPISEEDTELSQAKYVAKPMAGRMRDNILPLITISAYWRNLVNNSYPKQTKALWHALQRLHGRERDEFFTAVCVTTLEILNEKKTSISPEDSRIGIKVSQKFTFGTDSLVRGKKKEKKVCIYSEFIIHWEKLPTTTIMFLLTRHIID